MSKKPFFDVVISLTPSDTEFFVKDSSKIINYPVYHLETEEEARLYALHSVARILRAARPNCFSKLDVHIKNMKIIKVYKYGF